MSKRKLTVYGGTYDGIHRVIVAALTKRAAYEAIRAAIPSIGSYGTWDNYTSDSGNDTEMSVAMPSPLVVFSCDARWGGRDFLPITAKPAAITPAPSDIATGEIGGRE